MPGPHPTDNPEPEQDTATYLFTTRRLVLLGVICAVLGAWLMARAGGHSTPASAPNPATPPSAASVTSSVPPTVPVPATPAPSGTTTPAISPAVPTGQQGTPRGAPPTASTTNLSDAAAVAVAFATTSFDYDTAIDVSPADAQRRSIPFTTPAYAAQLRAGGTQPGGAWWNTLAEHHGYTTAALVENHDGGRPPDTATTAVRSWTVTSTGRSPDGWSAPMGTALVFVAMTRPILAAPWQVSGLEIRSAT